MSSAPDNASDDSIGEAAHPRITAIPADPARSDDLAGQRIGDRYLLERLIGSGSIGRTFRALREADAMPVALKLIDAHLAADETFMRRLTRDVDAAGKLEHLHVARIFEQGTDPAHGPFICRELVEGEDLPSALSRGALTPRRICELLIQVLSALSEAQRHGVLHRNLKPQNVLVSRDSGGREIVKVCDFGNPQRARPGAEYLAPELAAGQAIDGQADVYAVGIILYELLAGAVPFRGASPDETLALQGSAAVEPPRQKRPDRPLPRELEAVCLKALEKDPHERHRSPREMSQALRAVVSLLGMHADEALGSTVFGEGGMVADTASGDRMTMPGEHLRSHTKFWLGAALVAAVCVAVWLNPAPEHTVDSTAPTRSLSAARRNGAVALESGTSKLRAGDTQAAIVELRNARRALGDTPEVLRALGEALVIQGERAEGTQLLARYLELDPDARDRGFVQSLIRRAGEPE